MADPGSGSGAAAFPEPPKGDPGAIAAIARTLSSAGDELDRVDSGLQAASASLSADWQGYAANAYHGSSQGLAAVAHGGAGEFRDCARAVAGYGTALDHAQSEIRRLRRQWEDAQRRVTTAVAHANQLGTAAAAASHPAEAQRLGDEVRRAQDAASGAGREADGIAGRAQHVLNDFKRAARAHEQTIAGTRPGTPGTIFGSPFAAPGVPSPGFGAPYSPLGIDPSGLSNLDGTIPVGDPWNSPIPGYGVYMDATTPEVEPTDDLTNLIVGAATLGGGTLADLGAGALRSIAESYGIGGAGREAAQRAEAETVDRTLQAARASGETRSTSWRTIMQRARGEGKLAAATKAVQQRAGRADLADAVLEGLGRSGKLSLPPGAKEALVHVLRYGISSLTIPARIALDNAATRLVGSANPVWRAVGYRIRSMVRP